MTDLLKKLSYTSANTFPIKVLRHRNIPDRFGKILPVHLQLNPTNRCNLNCDFCSCSNRDRKLEWDFEEAKKTMEIASLLGCQAVTITGGGEPLLYSKINELIEFLHDRFGIQIGLVTNGTQFEKLYLESYKKLTWLRISHSDDRPFNSAYRTDLTQWLLLPNKIDWSFSYVLSSKPDYENICNIVEYANNKRFTHVRIVSNLLNLDHVPGMKPIKEYLRRAEVSDDLVIYQGRKEFVHGRKKCLISLLKPVIGADGKIYPCCSTQYAQTDPSLNYDESMCMGSAIDLYKIYQGQEYFDGSQCVRCYYDEYNELLDKMIVPIEHGAFV